MTFFEPPPPPERPEPPLEIPEPDPRWSAPGNELGAPVPLRVVLARTAHVAVMVVDMTAYTTGVSLTLALRWRGARSEEDVYADVELPFGRGAMRRPLGGELPPELRRFGVQFADGRKATTLGANTPWRLGSAADQEPPEPILSPGGGSGSDGELNEQYWLWPLPPPGTLTLAFEWPSKGIELSTKEVDAGLIIDASKLSEVLWPDAGEGTGSHHSTLFLHEASEEEDPEDEAPS